MVIVVEQNILIKSYTEQNELTESFGDGYTLQDGNEGDDDDGWAQLWSHLAEPDGGLCTVIWTIQIEIFRLKCNRMYKEGK